MSESIDERVPGWKRSLIGKLIAAGIFVVMGTVAVAFSMRAFKNDEPVETAADAVATENSELVETLTPSQAKSNLKVQPVSTETTAAAFAPATLNVQGRDTAGNTDSSSLNAKRARAASPPKLREVDNSFGSDNGFNPGQGDRFASQRPATEPPLGKSFTTPEVATPPSGSPLTPQDSFDAKSTPGFRSMSAQVPAKQDPPVESPINRFQQLANGSRESANNQLDNANSSNRELAGNSENTLRNFGDQAGPNSDNPADKNINPGSSSAILGPAATGTELPPITPRASFDTSKDLQPFSQQSSSSSSPVSQFEPIQRAQSSAPSNSPLGIADSANPPIRNSVDNPVNQENNRLDPALDKQNMASPIAAPVAPVAGIRPLTQPTPGDRNLEGMQAPSVTIEKIAPSEIQVNQPADFQLVVKNVGKTVANNVRVTDQIPAGSELIQAVPQPSRGPGSQISWELDSLDPGQEKRIKIQLRPTQPGEIGSVAQLTFVAQASMRTRVTKPILAVHHSTESRVLIGDPVLLDIDVKNEGDGPAIDVFIQEDLPEGLEFSEGFRELEYAIGTLGPGQSRNVRLELRAAKIGKYRNIMVAHAEGGLQTQHAIDLEVVAPNLVATGDGPTRRFLGRPATHRFAIRNSGTATATNVELVSRLPSGLKFVEANNRGRYDGNSHAVYWSLAELSSGLVANVEVTTVPTETGNQDLNFEASADLGQSTKAACQLAVEHLVDVFFDIDDLVDPIEVGAETAYLLRIVNQGTKAATNVQLAIEFPLGIQPIAVEGKITNEIRGQQVAFAPITSMNPGDEIEIIVKAKGITPGDHPVSVNLNADGREVNVSKQESTRVYADR